MNVTARIGCCAITVTLAARVGGSRAGDGAVDRRYVSQDVCQKTPDWETGSQTDIAEQGQANDPV